MWGKLSVLCRLSDRIAILRSIIGVKAVEPHVNGELRILYDLSDGRTATLAIFNDTKQRKLLRAKVGASPFQTTGYG